VYLPFEFRGNRTVGGRVIEAGKFRIPGLEKSPGRKRLDLGRPNLYCERVSRRSDGGPNLIEIRP
jgi:hypothetical protein